ncbi:MAG: DUF5677 domain-containing protein [Spirochaetota bacterium]
MDELIAIMKKYSEINLDEKLSNKEGLKEVSTNFYEDVAEIYDILTRVKNTERNPTGFNLNDAAVLGLLVRIWKLLKEVVVYYKANNGQIISHLDRQIIESSIIARYLLIRGDTTIEDYRKCSYKDRLRALEDAKNGGFYESPAGVRLIESINSKMKDEGFDINSFELQKKRRWKIEGKSFFDIFKQLEPEEFYKLLYGIPSESIHGSWNESLDFDLVKNDDGTYSPYPFYQSVDIRFITPILRLTNESYLLWLKHIDVYDAYFGKLFAWMKLINIKLFDAFEKTYDLS